MNELSPEAIAHLGFGFSPEVSIHLGLWPMPPEVETIPLPDGGGGGGGERLLGEEYNPFDHDDEDLILVLSLFLQIRS